MVTAAHCFAEFTRGCATKAATLSHTHFFLRIADYYVRHMDVATGVGGSTGNVWRFHGELGLGGLNQFGSTSDPVIPTIVGKGANDELPWQDWWAGYTATFSPDVGSFITRAQEDFWALHASGPPQNRDSRVQRRAPSLRPARQLLVSH